MVKLYEWGLAIAFVGAALAGAIFLLYIFNLVSLKYGALRATLGL